MRTLIALAIGMMPGLALYLMGVARGWGWTWLPRDLWSDISRLRRRRRE